MGQATAIMRKSLPSMMLFKSVETRLLIFPTRFPPFSPVDFFSSPLMLALSTSDEVTSDARVVEVPSMTSVLSGEWPEVDSVTEAVSGVGALVEGWLREGVDSGDSDFMRIRKACSNTSWVIIPCAWVRSLVWGELKLQPIRYSQGYLR